MHSCVDRVNHHLQSLLTGYALLKLGNAAPFSRPVPETLEPEVRSNVAVRQPLLARLKRQTAQFLQLHADEFNTLQEVRFEAPSGGYGPAVSRFTPPLATLFVAAVPHATVEGPLGVVYDAERRLVAPPGTFPHGTVPPVGPADDTIRVQLPLLASVVQTYGWMYHHWVAETLPRLVLLRAALPALAPAGWNGSLPLLTWGQPWEAAWLELLGAAELRPLALQHGTAYDAERLLLPSPMPAITPPAEALLMAREAVILALAARGGSGGSSGGGGSTAAVSGGEYDARPLLLLVSRDGERSRILSNQAALSTALRAAFPRMRLAVHDRRASPAEAVAMFSRAAAVVGPHGAGLSHILFCPPGTAVVELMFMHSPPMMFWHMAAALGLRYALAPLPHSFWGQPAAAADAAEVVSLLRRLLPPLLAGAEASCGPHFNRSCPFCPAGAWLSGGACHPCHPGRVATTPGSAFCRSCPDGERAVGRLACERCPPGSLRQVLRCYPLLC
jgi:hypothetical protein